MRGAKRALLELWPGLVVLGMFVALVCIFVYALFVEFADGASASCRTPKKVVIVNLDNRKHRPVLRHAWDAIRDGHPEFLHIARGEAEENRRESLRGHRDDDPDTDLDEYPPAMSDEGGKGASVRAIDSGANRSAGSVMGHQLRPFCDGARFRFERRPGPKHG